jgi:hypothetical protein
MGQPLVVSIPHRQPRDQVRSKLQSGLGQIRSQFGAATGEMTDTWTGDHCDFKLLAMGQTVNGRLDVQDDCVRLEVDLPWILAAFASKIRAGIEQQGLKLLEKK